MANLRAHAGMLKAPARDVPHPGPRPTAERFRRHAERFGPDQVAETAAEYGLDLTVARPKAKARARRPSLKARVAELVRAGHGADVVAAVENLSPSRARRLVEEVKQ